MAITYITSGCGASSGFETSVAVTVAIPAGSCVAILFECTRASFSAFDSQGNPYSLVAGSGSTAGVAVCLSTTFALGTSDTISVETLQPSVTIVTFGAYSGVADIGFAYASLAGKSRTVATQDVNNFIVTGFTTGSNGTGDTISAGAGNLRSSVAGSSGEGAITDNTSAGIALVTNSITNTNANIWVNLAVELRTVLPQLGIQWP